MEKPIRVLLVDDEERFVLNLAKLLTGRGFQTSTAFNGESAAVKIESGAEFDVVLLDVRMPGIDGIETLRRLKAAAPEIEVLMLTGHADVETGIEAMREGALDYLMKPCGIDELVEKLTEAAEVETMRLRPVLWPRRTVREITRQSFVRLTTADGPETALGVFMRAPGMAAKDELYLEDEDGRLAGAVTRTDLLAMARRTRDDGSGVEWTELARNPDWLPRETLQSLMGGGPPRSADPEAEIAAVARCMIENNAGCMPVVENDRLIGIVRLKDALKHLAQ